MDSAQFSSNGRYVLTASTRDGTARLWAASTGREIAVFANPEEENKRPAPTRAAFNSDGTRVVIASYGEAFASYGFFIPAQSLIDFAKQTVPRELTACERRHFFLPTVGTSAIVQADTSHEACPPRHQGREGKSSLLVKDVGFQESARLASTARNGRTAAVRDLKRQGPP